VKALVYTAPRALAWRQEPEPSPRPGEARVAVEAVGICGSDLHGWLGHDARRVPPLILGHEACGRILDGPRAGRRVVLNPLVVCGRCAACVSGRTNLCPGRQLIGMARPGAFAERISLPEHNLLDVPEGLSSAHAALTEPCGTAVHALGLADRALREPSAGRALVLGAGSVGLLTALLLAARGWPEVVLSELIPARRASAATQPGLRVLDPAAEAPGGAAFDLVVDAVGATATRTTACEAVRPGGVIVHIGLAEDRGGLDMRRLTLAEVALLGCYTYSHQDLEVALAALASGELGDLAWVEERPLADGARAFEDLLAGRLPAAKVVLRP